MPPPAPPQGGFPAVWGCLLSLPPPAPDGETYLFTTAAAAAMGVAVCTISAWRRRGVLVPVEGSPARKPLYRLTDLRKAEQSARTNAIRLPGQPAAGRVRRLRGVTL